MLRCDGYFRELKEELCRQGWEIVVKADGHHMFIPPNGMSAVYTGGSSVSVRGLRNCISLLRQRGFRW